MDDKEKGRFNFDLFNSLCDLDVQNSDKKKKRKGNEDGEEIQAKKEKALKNMQKLLDISERFSLYCTKKMKESTYKLEGAEGGHQHQPGKEKLLKELSYFSGTLRPYQIEGVIWMKVLFENAISGILADEMGLGKTIQIIAFLCHLMEKNVLGPFLIIVPLSTLPNWESEFQKFAPGMPILPFHGNKQKRMELISKFSKNYAFKGCYVKPVVITTPLMIQMELRYFRSITWKYMIIDEAQCIKNHNARIGQSVRQIKSLNKILLTGTPLQNNLTELWALLNFIMPNIFKNMETFQFLLLSEDLEDRQKIVEQQQSTNVISVIHRVLAPFMLRRLKCDVLKDMVPKKEVLIYCPLSKIQRIFYMDVIQKNLDHILEKNETEEVSDFDQPRKKRKCTRNTSYSIYLSDELIEYKENIETTNRGAEENQEKNEEIEKFAHRITMQNTMTMFKKIVNHPYMVHCPIHVDKKNNKTLIVDERLINRSGKMLVLDAILPKLKARGHKILLFSTLVMMLDLLEEYMILRNYSYCRLDGSQNLSTRKEEVETFMENSDVFIFLMSTRTGGLGLNLTAADTVIFYDRDWNPQADLQAQDRCHRIGQTKPVMVYSLITKNTIDERIINCGSMKRRLEKIVIKNGQSQKLHNELNQIDLLELKKLLENEFSLVHPNGSFYSDEELEALMERHDLYEKMNAQPDSTRRSNKKKNYLPL